MNIHTLFSREYFAFALSFFFVWYIAGAVDLLITIQCFKQISLYFFKTRSSFINMQKQTGRQDHEGNAKGAGLHKSSFK